MGGTEGLIKTKRMDGNGTRTQNVNDADQL